jgi:hypothetical protein
MEVNCVVLYKLRWGGGGVGKSARAAGRGGGAAEKREGAVLSGREVIYANFMIAGLWPFFAMGNQKVLDRALETDEVLREHDKACGKWLERDG